MRSVVVVFPASICAMIPMFRVFSSGKARPGFLTATFIFFGCPPASAFGACLDSSITWLKTFSNWFLVPEMAEGLVGLGHLVGIFLALDGGADVVGGVHQ